MEICARIGRVPGTRDRGSNETKQTRHLLAAASSGAGVTIRARLQHAAEIKAGSSPRTVKRG